MRAYFFLGFIFLEIRKKEQFLILSLESITSTIKTINLLKVAYHPVSCLLHLYIVKIRGRGGGEGGDVSFLHENMFFHDATCKLANKQEQLAKFQPFLKTSIF